MARIGFTGSQKGMTRAQTKALKSVLYALDPYEFHHGDCIGADSEAHVIVVRNAPTCDIFIHPPIDQRRRANMDRASDRGRVVRVYESKDFIPRNHDIVDATDVLVACPATDHEILRSGTWATIRYAVKQSKPVLILNPTNGQVMWDLVKDM